VLCRNGRVRAIEAGYTDEIEEDATGDEPMTSIRELPVRHKQIRFSPNIGGLD